MATIKETKEAIAATKSRMDAIKALPQGTPEYKAYVKAEEAYRALARKLWEENSTEYYSLQSDVATMEASLRNHKEGLNPSSFSNELERAWDIASKYHNNAKLWWVSEDEDYFILKVPGVGEAYDQTAFIVSRGNYTNYTPVEWRLYRTADVGLSDSTISGQVMAFTGGRMNQTRLSQFYKAIEENTPSHNIRNYHE